MKKIFCYFLLLFCATMLTSCSEKLSERNAKTAIIEKEGYPKPVSYEINKYYLKEFYKSGRGVTINTGKSFDDVKKIINYYENNGLVTVQEETESETTTAFLIGETTRTWVYAVIELTDKGREYLIEKTDKVYKVKIWDKSIENITGIQIYKERNSATVYYNEQNINITPFGELFDDKTSIENKTAYFSLFEDGWRID